jgi:hypothetical protein
MYQVLQIDVFGRLDLARVGEEILIGGNVTFSVSTELPFNVTFSVSWADKIGSEGLKKRKIVGGFYGLIKLDSKDLVGR